MNWRTLAISVFLAFGCAPAQAGIYSDALGKCLVTKTSDQDKAAFVRWIFTSLSTSPTVKDVGNVSARQHDEIDLNTAHLVDRLILTDCHKEAVEAMKYEEAQRHALHELIGRPFEMEFSDHGVSGATLARDRPGFRQLFSYVRQGDTLYVYAIDRLGRDALDVQKTIREFIDRGVTVHVRGLGPIAKGVGELIVAVLAQV